MSLINRRRRITDTRLYPFEVAGPQGPIGPQGIQGVQGVQGGTGTTGPIGLTGNAATLDIGATVTTAPGTSATVTNVGNTHAAIFQFSIPQGASGEKGDTGDTGTPGSQGIQGEDATVTAGTTTTGVAGSNATVVNSGTVYHAILDFTIPRGNTGGQGIQGIQGIKGDKGDPGLGSGDVIGPASATNGNIAIFDTTTGKLIKDSGHALSEYQLALTNPITGTGTTNELAYWASSSTQGTLPVATYPSLTELVYVKGVTSGIQSQINGKQASGSYEVTTNKATTFGTINDTLYPSVKAVNDAITSAVVGLLDYRGSYDASTNLFPATGGSGIAGAVLKGDFWIISVTGTLGTSVVSVGDLVISLQDTPAQTAANWDIIEYGLSYVPENAANKENTTIDTSTTKYPTVNLLKTGLDTKAYKTVLTVGFSNADYICDGTADNVQIQAAIDDLNTAGGGVILIKTGTYNLSDRVNFNNNIHITGEGETTIINLVADLNNEGAFESNQKSDISIENLKISYTGATSIYYASGIYFKRSNRIKIKNLYITGFGRDGITIGNAAGDNDPSHYCQDALIENNYIKDNGKNSGVSGNGISITHAKNVYIINNTIDDFSLFGIDLEGSYLVNIAVSKNNITCSGISAPTGRQGSGISIQLIAAGGAYVEQMENIIVSENNISNLALTHSTYSSVLIGIIYLANSGSASQAKNIVVCHNQIYNISGISVSGIIGIGYMEGELLIHHNQIDILSGSTAGNGIDIRTVSTNIPFSRSDITDNTITSVSHIGVTINDVAGGTGDGVSYTVISQNRIKSAGTYGVVLAGTNVNYCQILDNVITGTALTSTTDQTFDTNSGSADLFSGNPVAQSFSPIYPDLTNISIRLYNNSATNNIAVNLYLWNTDYATTVGGTSLASHTILTTDIAANYNYKTIPLVATLDVTKMYLAVFTTASSPSEWFIRVASGGGYTGGVGYGSGTAIGDLGFYTTISKQVTILDGGTNTKIRNNQDFVTENSGLATIPSGSTSIIIAHGLSVTPTSDNIMVTPTNSLGSAAKYYIGSITATTFTITVDADPGATTATFAWKASLM